MTDYEAKSERLMQMAVELTAERGEWHMKAEVNVEAADRLGRMLEEAEAELERLREENRQLAAERNIAVNTVQSRTPDFDVVAARIQCEQREAADRRATAMERRLKAVRRIADEAAADIPYDDGNATANLIAQHLYDALDASLGTPEDEKPPPEGVPCPTCGDGVTVEHQPSEPESRTWHRQYIEQYDLAAAAVRIVAWVNANGGEAELRFLGPDERRRIAIRTSKGWDYAKPGDRIVMSDKWFRVPRESRVPYEASVREFTISPVESSGSAE